MANNPITGYTELTALAPGDFFPVVDVSDNSIVATGTTKKIQSANVAKTSVTKTVAPTSSGFAADYYTDGTADNVEIQAAIDAVSALGGGAIQLRAGTYTLAAAVTIPSSISIRGEGAATIVKAVNSLSVSINLFVNSDTTNGNTNISIENVKFDGNQANRTGAVAETTGHNIYLKFVSYSRVSGIISINGFSSNLCLGPKSNHNIVAGSQFLNSHWHNLLLVGNSSTGDTVYENTISGNICSGAGTSNTEGVGIEVAKYATRNTFTGNTSKDNLEGGLNLFYYSNNNTVTGNSFYNNSGAGVYIVDASDYNTITANVIVGSGTTGVGSTTAFVARTGYYNVIASNTILNCNQNGIRGAMVGSTVESNIIHGCGITGTSTLQHGVYITDATDLRFVNNRVTSSYARGINITDSANAVISGNYIANSVTNGMLIDYASSGLTDSVISNNVIASNGGTGLVLFKGTIRSTISNNIIRANTGAGLDVRGASRCSISNNTISGNTSYGLDLKNDAASTGTTYCVISGNVITSNTLGGVRETGATDYNIYSGNNCSGNTAANFVTLGANNQIGLNVTT